MRYLVNQPRIGLLLSGGIDSSILLNELLQRRWQVVPFYVQTGCVWQSAELLAVNRFLATVASPKLAELVVLDMPLDDLYGDHWSMCGLGVPDASTADEAVFLPGRNPLLLLKPAIWCGMHGVKHLALATLASNPFSDATPKFFQRFEAMFTEATGGHVQVVRPLEKLPKHHVMEMGRHLPLELTFSCLSPINNRHCGRCNKCAERQRAFQQLGIDDPTDYQNSGTTAGVTDTVVHAVS